MGRREGGKQERERREGGGEGEGEEEGGRERGKEGRAGVVTFIFIYWRENVYRERELRCAGWRRTVLSSTFVCKTSHD